MPDKKQLKGHSDGPWRMSQAGVWVLWHSTGWSDDSDVWGGTTSKEALHKAVASFNNALKKGDICETRQTKWHSQKKTC